MNHEQVQVFFYGLFMDTDWLRSNGIVPTQPRRARLDDFALRIGRRATLVAQSGARSYGMVMGLTHTELDRLYGAPGLEQYRPETVLVHTLEGEAVAALCYNLSSETTVGERDPAYAAKLRAVLRKLEFPAEYVDSVG